MSGVRHVRSFSIRHDGEFVRIASMTCRLFDDELGWVLSAMRSGKYRWIAEDRNENGSFPRVVLVPIKDWNERMS